MPFKIPPKKRVMLRCKYTENYTMLMKDIKDLNKLRDILHPLEEST